MLEQFAFNIKDCKKDDLYLKFYKMVSEERAKKLERYHFDADKIRGLYAEILLRYALKLHGINHELISFTYGEYGKPVLSNGNGLHFNLSHSGDWVIGALSDYEVGIDVEQVKDRELDIAKRFFTIEEYEELLKFPITEQAVMFYKYWTLKESYVKAIGLGLTKSFTEFSFRFYDKKPVLYIEGKEDYDYHFMVDGFEKDYQMAVCTKEKNPGKCRIISIDDLKKIL